MSEILSCDELLLPVGDTELLITRLHIESGSIYRIVGNAASGAPEFMHVIAGLKTVLDGSEPATGTAVLRTQLESNPVKLRALKWGTKGLFDLSPRERALNIGFVWSDPELSFLGRTVREEYWYEPAALGLEPLPSLWGLREHGLYEKRDQDVFTLSGGEKHRLNIASVLCIERQMIVADFGNSNLDADFEAELMQRLDEVARRGAAVVIRGIEHVATSAATFWLTLDGGVLGSASAVAPECVKMAMHEQGELRRHLKPRTLGSPILVLDEARPQYAPASLTLEVSAGEIVVVSGRNGVGKTSIARCICDQDQLASGKKQVAQGVFPMMCLQNATQTFLRRTVRAELPSDRLLSLCGLSSMAKEHPMSLTSAEQKLLSAGVSLFMAKDLVVLDEPTSGLDLSEKIRLVGLINEFPKLGVLIFTHDVALHGVGNRLIEMV
jgi:energy-coupling factor transport system ATP-binding protein